MAAASSSLPDALRAEAQAELQRFPPFSQMATEPLQRLLDGALQQHYAAGQTVLEPDDGPVRHLWYVRHGAISGQQGLASMATAGFQYEAGDLFPVGAVTGERAVTATYLATQDTTCLLIPAALVRELAHASAPFADFLNRRMLQFVELSRRAVQVAYSLQTLAEQSQETRLGTLSRERPVSCPPGTPLAEALATMHALHIGSMLVTDSQGCVAGILTRHDVLGRVTLAGRSLDTPIAQVMTTPVQILSTEHTAQDAAVLMSRHGIRHVPVTESGRLVGLVSERDLFAMQRLSLKQVGTAIRSARDLATLQVVAQDIRRFAGNLLGQGLGARQITELISHLNDVLTARVVELVADQHGADLRRACWMALGSEGRCEQTIATDQDNGLVFVADEPAVQRAAWLAFAKTVNEALAGCGFPLCKGGVMAMNPAWCLTAREWCERFDNWIERGAPEDLLNASIFFDFRPLAGVFELVKPMRDFVGRRARAVPRFLRQMAEVALQHRPPLNWLGGIETTNENGREVVDLKLQGVSVFVEAARIYALAHGIEHTSTRLRLQGFAAAAGVAAAESEAWIEGFEFLQFLRLRAQLGAEGWQTRPNAVDVRTLNDIDRRILKETFRMARRLQQRLELDYLR
ncbi:DUF294 nucleotidyltransferase-like domain-containing protein [Schlegelella sp. S2-27]|uniref:DUF294 nucleotidyltransferase-like domain-containing protein n=1 Tax=Caldimonas mangrovi TaxID=2944811 RepID=A0ABT0YTH6_9BURK|nr:DUF294 nucleotidyltransferase-like domain-containing protein [Caldimonas mangrovi]